jgi:hypothetical protein
MLAARGYMSIDRGLPMSGNELNVLATQAPVNPHAISVKERPHAFFCARTQVTQRAPAFTRRHVFLVMK